MADESGKMETEEELRDRMMDMTNDELIETVIQKHQKAAEAEKLREELFLIKAKRESAERKVASLESEGHSLLSRAIEAEERNVVLSSENQKLHSMNEHFTKNAGQMKADAEELQKLRKEVDELRDAKKIIEQERKKAEEHNELRLSVEHAFNELSRQHEALQAQLDEALAEARMLRQKAKEDALRMQALQDEKDRLEKALAAANAEAAAAKEREAKLQAEFAEFRKTAMQWKKDAERALALESKCDSLHRQNEKQAKELKDLQAALKKALEEAAKFDEERKRWAAERKKDQANQFLKEQLLELQKKYASLAEREKYWLRERDELNAKIKRLQWELRNKNPSQLRLMELEVQNELLLKMLQSTTPPPNSKAHYGGSPVPAPRVLPPIAEPGSPADASASPLSPSTDDQSSASFSQKKPSKAPSSKKLKEKVDPDSDLLDRFLDRDAGEPLQPSESVADSS